MTANRATSQPVEDIASSGCEEEEQGEIDRGRRDKSADCCRAFVVWERGIYGASHEIACRRFCQMSEKTIAPEPSLIPGISRPL